MKNKLSLREIQLAEYDTLCILKNFFLENNISFSLFGGTLLGAIRHNGFIPWDDDIDITIPRNDYERLRELPLNQLAPKKLKFFIPRDKGYGFPYIKCCRLDTQITQQNIHNQRDTDSEHLFIDIFPLDSYYDNELANRILVQRVMFWRYILDLSCNHDHLSKSKIKNIVKKIIQKPMKYFSQRYSKEELCKKIDSIGIYMQRQDSSNTIGNLVWRLAFKDHFDRSFFSNLESHKFENDSFPIPSGYDRYLTQIYGDYMQLPKEDDRVWHEFSAYWINK